MPVLTASSVDRASLASRWNQDGPLVVISLCAAWCHTCREFREAFERIAMNRGDAQFVWLDIEDDHEICGDIDVENFPTLAVFRGDVPLHFGVSTPQEATCGRLIDELASRTSAAQDVPEEVRALPRALRGAKAAAMKQLIETKVAHTHEPLSPGGTEDRPVGSE
jgi:thioredoxin reductase (NADPH)